MRVADTAFNAVAIEAAVRDAAAQGAVLVATPELGITGYTAGDLLFSDHLIERSWDELLGLVDRLSDLPHVAVVVGLPVRTTDGRMYNCAAIFGNGVISGVVAKQYLPNRAEFYEDRWFTRALGAELPATVANDIPFGVDLLFTIPGQPHSQIGIEICEDLWAVEPPSGALALAGATIIVNPSGSPEQLGKAPYRRDLVRQQSARSDTAYLYAGSGPGESTMDVVFGGHSLIVENGTLLAETTRFQFDTQLAIADIDLQRLVHERHMNSSFTNAPAPPVRRIALAIRRPSPVTAPFKRPLPRLPFVPADVAERSANCEEVFTIQATGLAKRLRHTQATKTTIGISGGLDSTLALLVAARAFDALGLDRSGITAITMPGFGTTDRTYRNALGLMEALGTTVREIPIADAVRAHFADIGHDENDHNVVYENAQARERTQILMDVANQQGGFVIGTGDLSEAALGWMTFNGDHMSMYHVNAGVPKTLVRYLVSWAADAVFSGDASRILHDIVDTPITPELLPLKDGQLEQRTEDTVGPYELHDFFLFHVVRYGARPTKVFALAREAFSTGNGPHYDDATILKWLEVFHRRLFTQQFKRSSMPDGPKVGSVALSPRGDWRMPSDASAETWLTEIAALRPTVP
jgi:NAD+ synthase (glutamine-hydrolysing)